MTRVVTDSTAGLSALEAREWGIEVVTLPVVIDGLSTRADQLVGAREVAAALREHRVVHTSQPSVGQFLQTYQRLADEGAQGIVSVHLSGAMSGTCGVARLAAQSSPVPVTVVDSRSVAMGLGFAALSAAQAARRGQSAVEVAVAAQQRAAGTTTRFCLDSVEHLRRGGRLGRASATVGSALSIAVLLELREGVIAPFERVRTMSRALRRLEHVTLEAIGRAGPERTEIAVVHVDAEPAAEKVRQALARACPRLARIQVAPLDAVVGAHTGPGVVGAVVSPRLPQAGHRES